MVEDRCTQFRVIVVTDPQTNTQTGPITIHFAAKLIALCNNTVLTVHLLMQNLLFN